jgi:uncharacterized phage protein (TIGR02216 family)
MTFKTLAQQHGCWAMGVLGWSPADFWSATPCDVRLAWRGWCNLHGISNAPHACDRAAFEALLQQFPD